MATHQRKPDAPVEAPEETRDPCQLWKGNLRFQPQLQMRTLAPTANAKQYRGAPHDLCGD